MSAAEANASASDTFIYPTVWMARAESGTRRRSKSRAKTNRATFSPGARHAVVPRARLGSSSATTRPSPLPCRRGGVPRRCSAGSGRARRASTRAARPARRKGPACSRRSAPWLGGRETSRRLHEPRLARPAVCEHAGPKQCREEDGDQRPRSWGGRRTPRATSSARRMPPPRRPVTADRGTPGSAWPGSSRPGLGYKDTGPARRVHQTPGGGGVGLGHETC